MWCEVKLQVRFFACSSLFIEKDIFAHWLPLNFFQNLIDQVPGWISQLKHSTLGFGSGHEIKPPEWGFLVIEPNTSCCQTSFLFSDDKAIFFFSYIFSFLFSFIVSAPFPLVAIITLFLAQLFLFLLTHKKEICSVFSASSFERENIFLGIF